MEAEAAVMRGMGAPCRSMLRELLELLLALPPLPPLPPLRPPTAAAPPPALRLPPLPPCFSSPSSSLPCPSLPCPSPLCLLCVISRCSRSTDASDDRTEVRARRKDSAAATQLHSAAATAPAAAAPPAPAAAPPASVEKRSSTAEKADSAKAGGGGGRGRAGGDESTLLLWASSQTRSQTGHRLVTDWLTLSHNTASPTVHLPASQIATIPRYRGVLVLDQAVGERMCSAVACSARGGHGCCL